MIALLQRVTESWVEVDGRRVGEIGPGLLVLACAERGDTEAQADRLVERILTYRLFSDVKGKMNVSLRDNGGGLLLVPQFTLAADTNKGTRPSFTPAITVPGRVAEIFRRLKSRAVSRPASPTRFGFVRPTPPPTAPQGASSSWI